MIMETLIVINIINSMKNTRITTLSQGKQFVDLSFLFKLLNNQIDCLKLSKKVCFKIYYFDSRNHSLFHKTTIQYSILRI